MRSGARAACLVSGFGMPPKPYTWIPRRLTKGLGGDVSAGTLGAALMADKA